MNLRKVLDYDRQSQVEIEAIKNREQVFCIQHNCPILCKEKGIKSDFTTRYMPFRPVPL